MTEKTTAEFLRIERLQARVKRLEEVLRTIISTSMHESAKTGDCSRDMYMTGMSLAHARAVLAEGERAE
jgi:hypothetical protein